MDVFSKKQLKLANKIIASEKINIASIHNFNGQKYIQITDTEPSSRKLPDEFSHLEEWACNAVNLDTGSLCILYWLHDPASLCCCGRGGDPECDCEIFAERYNWDDIEGVWDTCEKWVPKGD